MKLSLLLGLLLICCAFTPAVNAQPIGLSAGAQVAGSTPHQTWFKHADTVSLILVMAGCVGMFVSSIYFIVRAFAVSATWGVCMLLFSGITMPLFCLFQFGQARRPLGILLLSIAAIVGGIYLSGTDVHTY